MCAVSEMTAKQRQLSSFRIENEEEMEAYCNLERQIETKAESIRSRVMKPSNVGHYFQQGRLVKVCSYLTCPFDC
jgi:rRNA-processing arch domain